ncbi:MAG TPA: DUF2946 domain-containing protein [Paraburkholderia sp.]|uniref:DUF2946 domain-containing protein n=1 Tax=Paraburkholderia sp. TaxID=1926495 RepID=UPI002CC0C848|nr:DUF2946 domain-containing protein [Paraburkholderia sp.]HTR08591.1 DUF2946 domain-containing protein [Paraburkholderia sp.]
MPIQHRTWLTAWLGIIAMCLAVLAPVVGQVAAARSSQDSQGVLCTASRPAPNSHPVQHDHFAACPYCDLLIHQPPISSPGGTLVAAAAPLVVSTTAFAVHFVPLPEFRFGRPRAPPV